MPRRVCSHAHARSAHEPDRCINCGASLVDPRAGLWETATARTIDDDMQFVEVVWPVGFPSLIDPIETSHDLDDDGVRGWLEREAG